MDKEEIHRKANLLVLVDDSQSMSVTDPNDSISRIGAVKEAFAPGDDTLMAELEDRFNMQLYQFSSDYASVKELSPAAQGTLTDIGKAISEASGEWRGQLTAGILLISDGGNNSGGNPVEIARQSGMPVYTVGVGSTEKPRDIQVAKVEVSPIAYADHLLPVRAIIKSSGYDGQEVRVSLIRGGEQTQASPLLDSVSLTLDSQSMIDQGWVDSSFNNTAIRNAAGADVPYGYRKVRGEDGSKFEVIEEEAIVVRRVFSEYLAGKLYPQIAYGLNQDGIHRHMPGPWEHWNIKNMIGRTDYSGTRYYGRKKQQADGKRYFVDKDHPEVVKLEVPRIVDDDTWERAHNKRESASRKAKGRAKYDYLLKGRISCIECGATYFCRTQKKIHHYYAHSFEHKDCPNAKVHYPCHVIDDVLKEFVIDHYASEEPEWTAIEIDGGNGAKDITGVERRLEKLAKRETGFQIMRADGEISAADFAKRIADIEAIRERLTSELAEMSKPEIIRSNWEPTAFDLAQMEYNQLLIERINYFDEDEWFEIIDYFDLRVQIVKRDTFIITGRLGEIVVDSERPI